MAVRRRAVFLDRDGVLNEAVVRDGKPYPPDSLPELHLTPNVRECLTELKAMGFLLIVVSNQPDVARGRQTRRAVEEINEFLAGYLPIDDTYICYHDNGDGCPCRKPAPGLLLEAARKHSIDLTTSFLIGDRWSDVEAGHRAQCKTLFINRGYIDKPPETAPTYEAISLRGAVDWIKFHTT
jgi:D-glycero-D-manno-heptose 1,7-bisphosphate phosphatase